MNHNRLLTIVSLLSIVLISCHMTDDIVRGYTTGNATTLFVPVLILVIWLYGALLLPERRSGYVIMLLGGLAAAGLPPSTAHRILPR